MRIIPSRFSWVSVFFLISGCGSDAESAANFELAKKECGKIAVKIAFSLPGSFDREHEAMAVRVMKDCLNKRGYDVELTPN